ncbi:MULTISPECIES: hypothetical protein [unclassified Lysinibacillus]|uniref:hypothetical protein n=1 Tax=unclassified Lysinibacillus TaxID=2636778 RepID=UPI002011FB46|nr:MULTISPECIES: hypothetical protein [unclassified Lysinibacillus]MCL1696391.1 hypothetical protein [Lysinibacillus sp. BPa_S21]MCL1700722.1 hypothetical protein [Lysinibacillus sp. Bpr_S20]
MVSRLNYTDEQEILNMLDYMNEQQEFTRDDAVWCNKTIKKLLLELHFIRNDIINQ